MRSMEKAASAYAEFLRALGLTPENAGIDIEESAKRASELMVRWTEGVSDERPHLSLMPSSGDEMVSLHELPFCSFCGHHFVPFFGTVDIDYVPSASIAGLGGFSRVISYYARRPQFQERLCAQIAEHLFSELNPRGVRVRIRARQMCLELNGGGTGVQIETVRQIGELN